MKKKIFTVLLSVIVATSGFAGLRVSAGGAASSVEKGFVYYLPEEPVTLSPFTIFPENTEKDIFFDGLDSAGKLSFEWIAGEQTLRSHESGISIPAVTPEIAKLVFMLIIRDETGNSNAVEIRLKNVREEINAEFLQPGRKQTVYASSEEADTGHIERFYEIDAESYDCMWLNYKNGTAGGLTLRVFDSCLNELQGITMVKGGTGGGAVYLPDGGTYYLSLSSDDGILCGAGDALCEFNFSLEADRSDPDYHVTERASFTEPMRVSPKITDRYVFIPVELDFYDIVSFDVSDPYLKMDEEFLQQYPAVPIGEHAFIAMSKGTYLLPFNLNYASGPFTVAFQKLSPDFAKAGTLLPGDAARPVSEWIQSAAFLYDEGAWSDVFEKYFYSYQYFQQESEYAFSYEEYESIKAGFEKVYRGIAKACRIEVPAGTALRYTERLEDPDFSANGEIMYFLADSGGFLASQQMRTGARFAEEYLYPAHFLPHYYFRQNGSMDKDLFTFLSDPLAPVNVTVPCGEDSVFYYMPYGQRASFFADGNVRYFDAMHVSFSLLPFYDRKPELAGEYRAGEEITVTADSRTLMQKQYMDDIEYSLQCESVYAEDEAGNKILFRKGGDGTFRGRIPSAGTYTLKAEMKGNEEQFGYIGEEERVINNLLTVRKEHLAEPYTVELGVFGVTGVLYGDVSGDGSVDGIDAGLLLQFLAEWDVKINRTAADVNADGTVDGRDAGLLLQYLAEWDVSLGA